MKKLYTFFLLAVSQSSIAQKILVPYRVDSLFGLADEKGKIVLQPTYDHMHWLNGSWFETRKEVLLNDTLETGPRQYVTRNKTIKVTGLVNNGKIVVENEPFNAYEIIAGKCIVARYEGRGNNLTKEQYSKYGDTRKLYSLFNLAGKNLYPDNFRSIRKMDTAGVSIQHKTGARYILFWVTHFNNNQSLLVFDCDKQAISKWLVQNARSLRPESFRGEIPGQILLGITDSVGNMTSQLLDYSQGEFVLRSTMATLKQRRKDNDDVVEVGERGSGSGNGNGIRAESDWGDAVAEPPSDYIGGKRPEPKFDPYHIFAKDSLFYITSRESKSPVSLPTGAKIIKMVPYSMTQYQPVIVIADNHFYIVKDDKQGQTAYDSLIYFGQNFLAWKKIDGKIKAGVIDANDSVIIPFQYDSLYAGIRYLQLVAINPAARILTYRVVYNEADLKHSTHNPNPYYRATANHVTVFKNGKCGVLNMNGDVVIPFKYDMVARNGMEHSRPRKDDFIVLVDKGRYGITNFKHDREKKRDVMSDDTIEPIFEYIPGFYYQDYYGVRNFKLIGLYNFQTVFMGYGTPNGQLFYQQK